MSAEQRALAAELGRVFAQLRERVTIHCAVCGAPRVAYATAKYCSNRCRQQAKYARVKDQRQESSTPAREAP